MTSHGVLDPRPAVYVSAATVQARIAESIAATQSLLRGPSREQAAELADLIIEALRAGSKLLLFGNGGSAADATHLAAEFVGPLPLRPPGAARALADRQRVLDVGDRQRLRLSRRSSPARSRPSASRATSRSA